MTDDRTIDQLNEAIRNWTTPPEHIAANTFINDYIERKMAQDEWDPDIVGVMRIAYAAGIEWGRKNPEVKE